MFKSVGFFVLNSNNLLVFGASFLIPPSRRMNVSTGSRRTQCRSPAPVGSFKRKGTADGRFSSPDWCSHLSVSADSGRGGGAQTAVGGRSGENYKVISLRFTRQLTGRNVAQDIINLPHDERMMISGSKSKGETSLV